MLNSHEIEKKIENLKVAPQANVTATAWYLVRMVLVIDESYKTNAEAKMCFWSTCMKKAYQVHNPKVVSQLKAKPAAMELKQELSLKESRDEIQKMLDRIPGLTIGFKAGKPFPVYAQTKKICAKLYSIYTGNYVGKLMLEKDRTNDGQYTFWIEDSRLDASTLRNLEINLQYLNSVEVV